MTWTEKLNDIFGNTQNAANTVASGAGNQLQQYAAQAPQQSSQSMTTGSSFYSPTITTTTAPAWQQGLYNPGTGLGGQLGGQYFNYPIAQPPTLTLKDMALLHRMCGDDEEVRAVLNKILPHFKLEA
jgi:hypothetical protein